MQLSKIKLSGFKSFVDPTTIELPGNLVAIVGPNGCGKSNVIDAITWVVGESSPKYLRGEALTDVIFNGSNARKPIGQASVELIFDNHDGAIGGEYSKFAEVSVKRVINRDSDSSYYLNGVRCRKRDVVDIFLGTGIGPRSYSIIGQNMISKVIEAKPDELRTYLEEAAGISKYKERRHETELRIQHTNENLARVNDLCLELEKQLSNLKHQANVAEKFKALKQQERTLRAELYALQWRQLDSHMVDYTLQIQREETALEARNSELISADRELEQLRHEQRVAHDAFQEVQKRYYAVGNEITRIEQDILHHKERQQQWENDLKQAEQDWQAVQDQLAESEEQFQEHEQDLQQLAPQLDVANTENATIKNELQTAEEATQSWQNRWDEFNQAHAKTAQIAQIEKNHIEHVEQQIEFLHKRINQLQQDKNKFDIDKLTNELKEFTDQHAAFSEKLAEQVNELNQARTDISTLQSSQQHTQSHLDRVRSELQRLRGQQASLEALQQTALGQRDNPATPWLDKHQFNTKTRLAQEIEVEKGWEYAVEKVLAFCLQAVCVDDLAEVIPHVEQCQSGNICIFTGKDQAEHKANHNGVLLIDKINSARKLDSLLAGIYVADSMEEALTLCESLKINESVITRDGIWLNRSWLKILREKNPAAGVFEREQELKQLAKRIAELQAEQSELEKTLVEQREKLRQLEQQRDQLQQNYNQQQAQAAQVATQKKVKQERLQECQTDIKRFAREHEECTTQLGEAQNELIEAKQSWQQAMTDLEAQANTREELVKERDDTRKQLQYLRQEAQKKNEAMHELALRLQTIKSEKASLETTIARLKNQITALTERKTVLQGELAAMPPLETLNKSLSRALDKHVTHETELNTARVAMESLDQEFRNIEDKRQTIEREINKVRTSLETFRVELQGWKVKANTLVEQLKETEFALENILQNLPPDITAEDWQTKLDQVVQRINRLGPINLVAIEEYTACLERKEYLDKQVADLQAGLAMLEDAISKIDKETKARFKETFDKVNEQFQSLFPTVFGGGKAYLELTSDDLLTAGVTMMACPPGKRNSSIYLLSGGEKSLTAIALIFSIFHLNPAPFCLLDEVDAALDDANVVRFTRLVKAMIARTQFIFISHNKITIEMAEHLIGVTMNEPGVSRLVSVDIEKAMRLAGTTVAGTE